MEGVLCPVSFDIPISRVTEKLTKERTTLVSNEFLFFQRDLKISQVQMRFKNLLLLKY